MRNNFSPAVTRRTRMDAREMANRRNDFAREDLCHQLSKDKLLYDSLLKDDRLDRARRARHYKALEDEQSMLDRIHQQREAAEEKRKVVEQHEAMVRQIQADHDELIRQEKIRQSIRESSVELRELEQKLHYAYMNAERAKQLQEKSLAQTIDQQREHDYAVQMAQQLQVAQAAERAAEEAAWQKSRQYKASLQNQLAEREDKKREDMELFLKEKAVVDELIRRIQSEDSAEQQRRLAQQRTARAFIDQYLQDRQKWLAAEQAKISEENARIEQYLRDQEARDSQRKEQKRAVEDARARVYETLADNIGRQEAERQEIEDLRVELAEAEQREREQAQDRLEMQRRIQQRLDLIDAYKRQIEEKRQRREVEREEEDVFRQRMLSKLADDARLDQLSREKKRLKQLEHKRAVDAMVEERRKQIEAEKVLEQEERRKEQELEEFRQRVIEQERQRLLREHASRLLGHLPKGVFKNQDDLDLFDEEFRAKFSRKP
ncbi:tumor suppressor, Mitostatin-domain-containing protein [Catenaria anguillulae PL171]|uniref:Meiosis-specific nuclear structural protein 1 n=1 Tax=Catenaria anguillulae PL171 TaxID=765915 RepID=A0A1Y2HUY7_9FUNG|nr:tumor suppressor, Mitostatin-domain-containing protein [Catenaria anguillulae PL171]